MAITVLWENIEHRAEIKDGQIQILFPNTAKFHEPTLQEIQTYKGFLRLFFQGN